MAMMVEVDCVVVVAGKGTGNRESYYGFVRTLSIALLATSLVNIATEFDAFIFPSLSPTS
jgi:hypothetical protein